MRVRSALQAVARLSFAVGPQGQAFSLGEGKAGLRHNPMGYEVHITRAEDWTQSQQHSILEKEWLEVVHSDPTLQVSDEDYLGDGSDERHHAVVWLAHPARPQFWYENGMVTKKHPDELTLAKMAEIAQKLNARVVDDDGAELGEEEESGPPEQNHRSWWQKLFKS